ncbi:MAG: type VI secretion system baseplate subunit TssE [Pseudomonadota bacterium]
MSKSLAVKRSPRARDHLKQMTLLDVFRASARDGDARTPASGPVEDGDRTVTARSKQRRSGINEDALKRNLSTDIASLMNTVRLDAVVPLDDTPYVKASVVNYGFRDMSSLAVNRRTHEAIETELRQTLENHEPRLSPASIEVRYPEESQLPDQRMTFDVTAEMLATPHDIPLDFLAEVDIGAGKVKTSRFRVQT